MPSKTSSLAPWMKPQISYYDHQREGIRILMARKSWILADQPGLGKSLQALAVFACDVVRELGNGRLLVVCPASIKQNWLDEIEAFTTFYGLVLDGGPAKRKNALDEFAAHPSPKILVVGYEQVRSDFTQINNCAFHAVVYDEAHAIKNPSAKRTKVSLALYSKRSFLLTGTPLLNRVDELWTLLHRVDPEGFPRFYAFKNRYVLYGEYGVVGPKNEAELKDRLDRVMLRRLKKDVLDLPGVQYIPRRVTLAPAQRKMYDRALYEFEVEWEDGEVETFDNSLTRLLRLKQICGTTAVFDGHDVSAKLDAAVADDLEILDNGEKIVTFTQFRGVLACYCERLRKAGVTVWQMHGDLPAAERQGTIAAWARSKSPGVLACMFQVAGLGLNMTAARQASMLDKLFVPGLNAQATDRLHRIGASKSQPVQVREYIARGTVETRIEQILATKTELSDTLIEGGGSGLRRLLDKALAEEIGRSRS